MAKGKRGRPRKDGPRKADGSLERGKLVPAPEHILERRHMFSFVVCEKGGNVDQDTCDGIGQFHALGLLDGHPIDGKDLRDVGRVWRDLWLTQHNASAAHAAGGQRIDTTIDYAHTVIGANALTAWDAVRFARLDDAVAGFERSALMDLLIAPIQGSWPLDEENAPWVRSLIAEALLKRGRVVKFCKFPDENDRSLLRAAIRGLFVLHDAGLRAPYERRLVA